MQMTGGQVVAQALRAHGVDVVFGIPGVHNLAIYDALLDSGIRHIVARHEQGAAFMADGYARASGRIGVCLCTSGPALLNAVTSLGTAYADSVPVLCIASQIPLAGIGKQKGYIHECPDQLACVRPVTSWCARADSVDAIPGVVREAFEHMLNGRPRPTAIEVPCDVLDGEGEVEIPEPATRSRPQPSVDQIEAAAALLSEARRPAIWAGGGAIASAAGEQLQQVAELLQAPVFTTINGKGSIPGDHPLSAGSALVAPAAIDYVSGCDALLAVGTRFTEEGSAGWTIAMPPIVHVDIDAEEMGRNYDTAVAVVGDAREALQLLSERLASRQPDNGTDRTAEVDALRKRIVDDCIELAPQGVELVQTLQRALPRETVIVYDLTLAAYWCRWLLDTYEHRTNLYPWGFCTLGFGVPAGIGAKVACPERPVVIINGDGGFMFNLQELSIAAQFDIPVVVLIFDNGGFGIMRPQQVARYGRTLAVDLENPDFAALSRTLGLEAVRVDTLTNLGSALTAAIDSGKGWVIHVTAEVPLPVIEPRIRPVFDRLQELEVR